MKKYKYNETEEQYLKKEQGVIKDLTDLDSLMKKEKIIYWLTSGTLLGSISRDRILPYDRDVDLGMWAYDSVKFNNIVSKLEGIGFKVQQRYDPLNNKVKGMITIKRHKAPIDIKVYDIQGNYVTRGIHKTHNFSSRVTWDLIDIIYFKKSYRNILGSKRRLLSFLINRLLSKLTFLISSTKSKQFIDILSERWRNDNVTYGMEIIPKKYPSSLIKRMFYDIEVHVFKDSKAYLDEEYGKGWDQHNPNGRGGTDKYSHVLFNNETLEAIKVDKELYKRCKAVGYIK